MNERPGWQDALTAVGPGGQCLPHILVREHNVRREYAVEVLNWPEHQGWPAAILEPGWRRSVLLVRPRGSVVIS